MNTFDYKSALKKLKPGDGFVQKEFMYKFLYLKEPGERGSVVDQTKTRLTHRES